MKKNWTTYVESQQKKVRPKNSRITSRFYLCVKTNDFPQQGVDSKWTLSSAWETICHITQFSLLGSQLH